MRAPTVAPNSAASSLERFEPLIVGDVAVLVLVDREAVDHLDGVRLSEAVELGQDLTPEIGLLEAEDEQLYWSDCHRSPSI